MADSNRGFYAIIIFLCLILVGFALLRSDLFAVHAIEINGNRQVSSERILALLGPVYGTNIWQLDTRTLAERIRAEPWIDQVHVRRKMPAVLQVSVVERALAALVPYQGTYLAMDGQGVYLRSYDRIGAVSLPLVTGMQVMGAPQAGKSLEAKGLPVALAVIAALSPEVSALVGEIHISGTNIYIYTREGVQVRVGDIGDLPRKLALLAGIYRQQRQEGNLWRIEYIDLRYPQAPALKYAPGRREERVRD
ncbi:MAG: FtsQ-type POTRA domain-containing protein [Clostridia bacterium]|nr:MAG: FtsQ-type POTRA domain-containing protein [Clostridia bacterium]